MTTNSSDGEWIKPTCELGDEAEIVGLYGYADEFGDLSSIGFTISSTSAPNT